MASQKKLSLSAAQACVAAASDAPFAAFISPGGSTAFRNHIATRVKDLRCCFTPTRHQSLKGQRLRLAFVPVSRDPAGGAVAEVSEPFDPQFANEAVCINGVAAKWRMPHAPVSDMIRLDADGKAINEAGSVVLSWPL